MQQGVQQQQTQASDELQSGNSCSNKTRIELSEHWVTNTATTDNGDTFVTGTPNTTTSQTSNMMVSSQPRTYPVTSIDGPMRDSCSSVWRHPGMLEGPTEGHEAPAQHTSQQSPPQSALIHPCLPASPPPHSSPSEGEPDPAEIYVHHKKFRRHRKRAATVEMQVDNHATCAQYDDSLCSEAKKNCNTTTPVEYDPPMVSSHNQHETTCPKSDSPVSVVSEGETFETLTTSDKLCRASEDLSVSSPSDVSSSADDCDVMDSGDITHDFSYEAHSPPQRSNDAFAVNVEQTSTVHACGWLQCTRQFPSLDELVNHVNDTHVRAERDVHYKCYWANCPRRGKGFNARYKMLIHVRTHTNERPYKCALCHKSFSRLENLKIHNRSHTGERPYVCPFEGCKKAYSNSSDRFKHVRTHQEQKPYNCRMPGCDKRYTDPSSLRKHIKTHGHYYRGPDQTSANKEKVTPSGEAARHRGLGDEAAEAQRGEHGDVFVSGEKLLSLSSAAFLRGFAPSEFLLSPGSSQLSSALTTERLLELRAREDFQNKAFLEASGLFSGLSLSRHPLLGLGLGYPLPDSSHYSGSAASLERPHSSLLMPLPHNVTENRSYLASLGSTGSLSPGSLSDSSHGASTDSDSCGSPPLPFCRTSYDSVHMNPRSPILYPSSPSHPSLSQKQSAFSPVSPSPYPADKYSLVPSRSPLVSRHPRHSPVHHPYSRSALESETSSPSLQSSTVLPPQSSPVFRRYSRPERPLDLSNPGSPLSAREESPARLSPGSAYSAYDLPMHCHTAPKCDLGPAFPALRLLNHA